MKRAAMLVVLFLAWTASSQAFAARAGTVFETAPVGVAASAKAELARGNSEYPVDSNLPFSATDCAVELPRSGDLAYCDQGDGVGAIPQGCLRRASSLVRANDVVLCATGSVLQ